MTLGYLLATSLGQTQMRVTPQAPCSKILKNGCRKGGLPSAYGYRSWVPFALPCIVASSSLVSIQNRRRRKKDASPQGCGRKFLQSVGDFRSLTKCSSSSNPDEPMLLSIAPDKSLRKRGMVYFTNYGKAKRWSGCRWDEVCQCRKTRPRFRFPGDSKVTCCSKCKSDGMVDVRNRKCECGRCSPSFGFPGGRAQPSFGFPGNSKATCFSKCKSDAADGMAGSAY
eukprot:TRINITY_DN3039_c0_g2_i3.p2 TRINITY_DN3039_c0_g2~~TRINITY_DN3039_c0_g2_i3.p2  ORF type:complete len:225 (-),score=23.09 TRINITY_DN3039_c0_g2_i3:31-705(-)